MGSLMEAAPTKGLKAGEGDVLTSNRNMLQLVATLGLDVVEGGEDESARKIVRAL